MKNNFNFCPICSKKTITCINNRKWLCKECGFELYCNIASAVGVIIKDKYNNCLFEIRAKEPQKGKIVVPGGFVDADETLEQAAIRECKEEIGVNINKVKYLCSAPNTYPYKNIEYKTCDVFFTAELPASFNTIDDFIKSLKAEEDEVSGFVSCKIGTEQEIEKLPIAFNSAKEALKIMIKEK